MTFREFLKPTMDKIKLFASMATALLGFHFTLLFAIIEYLRKEFTITECWWEYPSDVSAYKKCMPVPYFDEQSFIILAMLLVVPFLIFVYLISCLTLHLAEKHFSKTQAKIRDITAKKIILAILFSFAFALFVGWLLFSYVMQSANYLIYATIFAFSFSIGITGTAFTYAQFLRKKYSRS